MKTLFKTFSILIVVLTFSSCKNETKKADNVTIETTQAVEKYVPPSDKLFVRVIKDFDDKYMDGAETVINEAILAIEYEGAGLDGLKKNAFVNAINDLKEVNKKIKVSISFVRFSPFIK